MVSLSSRKKKKGIFCIFCLFCPNGIAWRFVFYLNVYYIQYTFIIIILFYTFTYQKISLHILWLLVFKIVKIHQCNLNSNSQRSTFSETGYLFSQLQLAHHICIISLLKRITLFNILFISMPSSNFNNHT